LETQSEVGNIYAKLVLDTRKLTAEWPGHFSCKARGITTHRFSGIGGEKGIELSKHDTTAVANCRSIMAYFNEKLISW